MTSPRCEDCEHWERNKRITVDQGESEWGTCNLMRSSSEYYPETYETEIPRLATSNDASDYSAWVSCRADFGCVMHSSIWPDTPRKMEQ